jgi:hypothetical protein
MSNNKSNTPKLNKLSNKELQNFEQNFWVSGNGKNMNENLEINNFNHYSYFTPDIYSGF